MLLAVIELVEFVVPDRLEGTVWFDAGAVGRMAVNWGPTEGAFTLPAQGMGRL